MNSLLSKRQLGKIAPLVGDRGEFLGSLEEPLGVPTLAGAGLRSPGGARERRQPPRAPGGRWQGDQGAPPQIAFGELRR